MVQFGVTSNIADSLGFLGKPFHNQIQFATAKAFTATAKLGQATEG